MSRSVRNESWLRRLANNARPIPKKLRLHMVVTGIRVLVGVVTFTTLVFAGYYGLLAWLDARRTVAESNLERVVAEVRQYNDVSERWTDEKIADVGQLPFVDFGYPYREISVQLTVDGKKFQTTSLEGVVGREPELQPTCMTWGEPVGRESKPEIIISRRFFERLGGRTARGGRPEPSHVAVVVTRTVDGAPDIERLEMRVAGLLTRDSDKTYGPLDLVINLDRWQTHKSNSPLGEAYQTLDSLVTYAHVDAYVFESLADQVPEEEATFDVQAERSGEVEIVVPQGDLWAKVVPKDAGQDVEQAVLREIEQATGDKAWPVWLARQGTGDQGGLVFAALREGDPRWANAPGGVAPELGKILATHADFERVRDGRPASVAVERIDRPLPGVPRADCLGTFRTLRWIGFDERASSLVTSLTKIEIEGVDDAVFLHELYPGEVWTASPLAWSVYELDLPESAPSRGQPAAGPAGAGADDRSGGAPGAAEAPGRRELLRVDFEPDGQRSAPAGQTPQDPLDRVLSRLSREVPGCDFGLVHRGIVEVTHPASASAGRPWATGRQPARSRAHVRIVPTELFYRVAETTVGELSRERGLPCVLMGQGSWIAGLRSAWVGRRELKPYRTIRSRLDEIWLPATFAGRIRAETTPVGLAGWGPWHETAKIEVVLTRAFRDLTVCRVAKDGPQRFWMLKPQAVTAWQEFLQRQFDPERVRASALLLLPASLRTSGQVVAQQVVAVPDAAFPGTSDRQVFVPYRPGNVAAGTLELGWQEYGDLIVCEEGNVLPGHARVSMAFFRRLAFEHAERQKTLPEPAPALVTVRYPDVHAFWEAERRLASREHRLEPMVELAQAKLWKYAVRAVGQDGQQVGVSSQKAGELVMAQPTFHAVTPRVEVAVEIDGKEVKVRSAVGRDDLLWFESRLVAGLPLGVADAENETEKGIVLSREIVEHAFPGFLPAEVVGRSVRCKLARRRAARAAEPDVQLLLRVTGVTDSPDCVALDDDVVAWRLWQDGSLVYDKASNRFRTPAEVYRQRGFIAAIFYATSEQDVRPLVEHLERMGCEVRHRLDEQAGLARMAVALATLVLLFVSGSVVNASANSGAVSWMDLSTKLKEIGVKMAYGVTRGDIVFAYVAEGFIVGALACVTGALIILGVDPLLRDLIHQTMGVEKDFFIVPVISATTCWIFGVAAAVVIGFNILGTVIPTCLALRKSPVELMQ